jgi:hypothetical protein
MLNRQRGVDMDDKKQRYTQMTLAIRQEISLGLAKGLKEM